MPRSQPDPALYQPFPMIEGHRGQIWRYAPEYRRPRHFHAEPELNLVVHGSGLFGTGRQTLRVSAGDLLCWPPGRDHELIEASEDFDLYVVALTPELNERVLASRSVTALASSPLVKLDPTTFESLHALCAAPIQSHEPSRVEDHVSTFWQRAHEARIEPPHSARLTERILRSLLEHPEIARSERAALVGAYPTELSRRFHREFGLALNDYRTRLRLLHFVQRIDAGGGTLLSAALEAGFGSYSQCHRAFRDALGCTPRAFFKTDLRDSIAGRFAPWDPIVGARPTECEDLPAVTAG